MKIKNLFRNNFYEFEGTLDVNFKLYSN